MKILLDFTRICSESLLTHYVENLKVYFLNKSTDTLLKFENNLAINVLCKILSI